MACTGFEETRAFARLPGLDIAVMHRAARDGDGEQLAIALRAMPATGVHLHLTEAADPFLLWARLTQMAWTSWLACLAMASASPWITRRE